MTDDIAFPRLAKKTSSGFRMAGQMRGRETAITGAESIIPSFAGHWVVTISFLMHTEAASLEWQGFLAQMEGGIGTTLVPVFLPYRPKNTQGGPASVTGAPAFSTFEHWSFVNEGRAAITLATAADLRATDLDLTLSDSLGLRPGHGLTLGDRFHRVQRSWEDGSKVRVQPPLRQAAVAGAVVETDNPVCRMRFASEGDGEVDFMPNRVERATVTFREAF
ncbi:hypothetical protein UM399_11875 [Sulfitobacter pontiacus]|uniref:hypothetical protein n=1 Tax=Sulfitobacter pontiacus TaxID=60137 RepID=UPI002AC9037F|nr:hypothetical protein [Sulfitobacter pontiacus]WPZ24861.1 hypothetical protein UM399_11875 [Sulfitobacter pontiacus]|tara:strand:+ start:21326 stop:21985 length:660 start_codon:yes stop_codon:yes gene_type:complete